MAEPRTQNRRAHDFIEYVGQTDLQTTDKEPAFPWPSNNSTTSTSSPVDELSAIQTAINPLTTPHSSEANCKYRSSDWSSCDPETRSRTRERTLDPESSSPLCNSTIVDIKPCFTRSGRGKFDSMFSKLEPLCITALVLAVYKSYIQVILLIQVDYTLVPICTLSHKALTYYIEKINVYEGVDPHDVYVCLSLLLLNTTAELLGILVDSTT